MAKLAINWRSVTSVAPQSVTTGDTEEVSAEKQKAMIADKPMMVYVMSDDQTDSATKKIESLALAREQVGVGSKFFDTIKMTAGDAAQDRLIKEAGRSVPRFVFLSRDYKVVNVLEGNELSGGGIVKAMESVVRQVYVNSFNDMVREYTSLLNELDRLESRKAAIESQKARAAEKADKARDKKIAKDEAEYKADMDAFEAKEKKLLEFKAKGVEPGSEA
jgi:hypothetical protein